VSGDQEIGRFYYEELIGRRDYMRLAAENAGYVWLGEATNYSNVNMLAIALATLGRVETDPYVREDLVDLIDAFWDNGGTRSSRSVAQPWFDVIVAGFGRAPQIEVPGRMASNLIGHGPVPTFQRDRINCDEAEIAAGSCIGIDGTTVITIAEIAGHGGSPVATAPLPLGIRPDTNFLWRSDPHELNAGQSNRLNPRGDWLAAYWVGRLLDLDPAKNVVDGPPPLPTGNAGEGGGSGSAGGARGEGGGAGGASAGDGDDAAPVEDGGCGCRTAPVAGHGWSAVALAGLVTAAARRSRRARGRHPRGRRPA
jgi:MYXO-CTERM domain-containing protein